MRARVLPRLVSATLAGALVMTACGHVSPTPNQPRTDGSPTAARTADPGVSDPVRFHPDSEFPGPDDLPAPGGKDPLVPASKIISGGPPPDGITPIDHPRFTPPSRATFLASNEPVLSVTYGKQTKAYPLQILTWHEIVNDSIRGTPFVVTYCPLCNTGIAFLRPTVQGHLLDFGTSGKLYDSNLLMYDRQTWTLWAQAVGQAVAGPLTGMQLRFVSAQILPWSEWRATYPDGLVLSRDTGATRNYGENPYPGYDDSKYRPFLFLGQPDPRLPPAEHVLGIDLGGHTIAFPFASLAKLSGGRAAAVNTVVGGRAIVVFWMAGTASALDARTVAEGKDVGAATAYLPRARGRPLTFDVLDGAIVDRETGSRWSLSGVAVSGVLKGAQLTPVIAINSLWFDWAAFHPKTSIWSGR